MRIKLQILYFLLSVLLLSACATPEPEEKPLPVTEETALVQPTATRDPGYYPLSTRTDIPDVDAVIAAVESEDPQQLRNLIRFTTVGCTTAEGLGGPPKCKDGEADSTLVDVLPFLGPEGHFMRKTELSSFSGVDVIGIYAVYNVSDTAYSEEAYPVGEYAVMFRGGENQPDVVIQIRGGVIRMDTLYPPTSLDAIIQRDAAQMILVPQQ
jgi:hypothetical protein